MAHETAREKLAKSAEHRKELYDRNSQRATYNIGDLVYIEVKAVKRGISKKLFPKWEGPYHVIKKLSEVTYCVKNARTGERKVLHVNRMRKTTAGETRIPELADNHHKRSQDEGCSFSSLPHNLAPRGPAGNEGTTVGYPDREQIAPGIFEELDVTGRMTTNGQQTMPPMSSVERIEELPMAPPEPSGMSHSYALRSRAPV
ncbi:uncharacterized protein LOC121833194 [Ixodes scapularis]|uniref:uncharacterized protein LOC121833194 n=1 Tax=Ixodes scapularis TaxID=6945 RepID=UPI001C37F05A|nr:uncharacterized protein LOC121833194 [Ixodes scapularis]